MAVQKKQSVLIVDDDSLLLDIYTRKFKEQGHEIHAALSGEDALKILREGYTPSVLVVDIVMPGMDGFAFLETVRKENLRRGAVVVVLSNQSQKEDIDRGIAAGADGYIVKAQATPSEVLEKVMGIVTKKQS